MAQLQVLEGTWEEIKLHDQELLGKRFRLVPVPPVPVEANQKCGTPEQAEHRDSRTEPRQLTGMGKFSGIIPSSEEFIRQKHEDMELEERKFRR